MHSVKPRRIAADKANIGKRVPRKADMPATAAELADLKAQAAERDARFVLANHPHIGELTRNGRKVYYRNFPAYVESTNPRDLI